MDHRRKSTFISRISLCSILLLSSATVRAQEQIGYLSSNYAGVNATYFNPSSMVDAKMFIDVHLVGFHAFAHTNAAYLPKKTLSYKEGATLLVEPNEKNIKKRGYVKADAIGPSVGVSWAEHSFGVYTRFRNNLSAMLTKELAFLAVKEFRFPDYIGKSFDERAYASTLSWFEVGFSYGHMFQFSDYSTINVGGTIKRLKGVNSASAVLNKFEFFMKDEQDIDVFMAEGGYRYTTPAWGIGNGWGMDLGATYQKKLRSVSGYKPNTKKNGCKSYPYLYKAGVALVDLGTIKVKNEAISQEFSYDNQDFVFDSLKIQSVADFDEAVQDALIQNALEETRSTTYRTWLPLGINLSGDYNFLNGFYMGAAATIPLTKNHTVRRAGMLAFIPRYEHRWFEVALPVSLAMYKYPQLGLSLRLGNYFIIGTDRLDSFRGKVRDVYGGDIYFHLKFAIYKKCKKGRAKFEPTKHCPAY